ncbi:unnamed protein product (macronuclear) [Paramecium tetraurelia]|uniref:Uncharacterized protein n=1 Tax=Paramecium tetraurelia TaxID=5888 RepID=A0CHR6_PARTE|nr:uncharacterized protein GSPATT00038435001 [Paramecium tetraurelia]CAK70333.1 unnamed protein product [Paramecium tetraurelia]|eukprot:XP_001437730.1 hypothetical protein (macronuclear) [Paramecium tetraurelia strain d4-2]
MLQLQKDFINNCQIVSFNQLAQTNLSILTFCQHFFFPYYLCDFLINHSFTFVYPGKCNLLKFRVDEQEGRFQFVNFEIPTLASFFMYSQELSVFLCFFPITISSAPTLFKVQIKLSLYILKNWRCYIFHHHDRHLRFIPFIIPVIHFKSIIIYPHKKATITFQVLIKWFFLQIQSKKYLKFEGKLKTTKLDLKVGVILSFRSQIDYRDHHYLRTNGKGTVIVFPKSQCLLRPDSGLLTQGSRIKITSQMTILLEDCSRTSSLLDNLRINLYLFLSTNNFSMRQRIHLRKLIDLNYVNASLFVKIQQTKSEINKIQNLLNQI